MSKKSLPPLYDNYPEWLKLYKQLVEYLISTSDKSGGVQTESLYIESTKIFTRTVLSCMTINSIFPYNHINNNRLWDQSSIGTLTRSVLETMHRFLYLTEQGLSEEEKRFRLKLYYYHVNCEKYKMHKGMQRSDYIEEFEQRLPQARLEIVRSDIYKKLEPNLKRKIRKGYTDMYKSDIEIAKQYGLIGDQFGFLYRLLSNHAHGAPFSVYSQSNDRGRGEENDIDRQYLILYLMALVQYISKIIPIQIDILKIRNLDGIKAHVTEIGDAIT